MNLTFTHPPAEIYFLLGIPLPQAYKQYQQEHDDGRVFALCSCSDINAQMVIDLKTSDTKSATLRQIVDDMTLITVNLINSTIRYLRLSKPIFEYPEDAIVKSCLIFFEIDSHERCIYEHVQSLGVEPQWDYVLLHYLENRGYCSHGSSIRGAYRIKNE